MLRSRYGLASASVHEMKYSPLGARKKPRYRNNSQAKITWLQHIFGANKIISYMHRIPEVDSEPKPFLYGIDSPDDYDAFDPYVLYKNVVCLLKKKLWIFLL